MRSLTGVPELDANFGMTQNGGNNNIQTDTQTHHSVYRIAPQLKMNTNSSREIGLKANV